MAHLLKIYAGIIATFFSTTLLFLNKVYLMYVLFVFATAKEYASLES